MMSSFHFYLITRMDVLQVISYVMFGISLVATVIMFFVWIIHANSGYDRDKAKAPTMKKIFFWTLPSLVFFMLLSIAAPNTKQAIAIVAAPIIINDNNIAKGAETISNTVESVAELADASKKTMQLINNYLTEQLKEQEEE
jgi:accessory gene regulator protein AgrB